jgi:hypothetical protein
MKINRVGIDLEAAQVTRHKFARSPVDTRNQYVSSYIDKPF